MAFLSRPSNRRAVVFSRLTPAINDEIRMVDGSSQRSQQVEDMSIVVPWLTKSSLNPNGSAKRTVVPQ